MLRNERLENEILQRIDALIQHAISVNNEDETARARDLARGVNMVEELGDLLLEILEGKEEHLQALLEQLVAQRLPERRILQSFGNFPRDIHYIIGEGVSRYLKKRHENKQLENDPLPVEEKAAIPEPDSFSENATDDTSTPDDTSTHSVPQPEPAPHGFTCQAREALRLALLQAYPDEEIIADYETRGGKIDFFLPRQQLGFELVGTRYDWRHDFYCRRQGISIRKVAPDELANPIYLARRLRREAYWRQTT
ncbi:hypothetical protein MHOCP_12430 [Moorella humiferrea]|uniref:hypothetical protein n=1 Tax=Neomoorella humiferrea TaxID=676965 RepID=UPI0030D466EC